MVEFQEILNELSRSKITYIEIIKGLDKNDNSVGNQLLFKSVEDDHFVHLSKEESIMFLETLLKLINN